MRRAGTIPPPNEKVCRGCHVLKPIEEFSKNGRNPDGFQQRCKACVKAMHADHYQRNSERIKAKSRAWSQANPEQKRETGRNYRQQKGVLIRAKQRQWRIQNRDRILPLQRAKYWNSRDEIRQRAHARYWADPEQARAKRRNHYQRFYTQKPEARLRQKTKARERYLLNKDRYDARKRVWIDKNKARMRAVKSAYKARKRNAAGRYTGHEWETLCNWFGNVCLRCGASAPLTVDHVVPLNIGGANDITNLQPLCVSCNSSKRDTLADYRDPERLPAFLQHLLLAIE